MRKDVGWYTARNSIKVTDRVYKALRIAAKRAGKHNSDILDIWLDDHCAAESLRRIAATGPATCPECQRPVTDNHCTHCQQKGI